MCGRFSLTQDVEKIKVRFHADFVSDEVYSSPRYNAAPSQKLPVISNADPAHINAFTWGLHPKWLSKVTSKSGLINVKMETLRDKHTFKSDLVHRRCLVPADGFYEWRTEISGPKTPFRITLKDGGLFAFGGIWEKDERGESSFAIITTEPNSLLIDIHNRMPVILTREAEQKWLAPDISIAAAIDLLIPYPAELMKVVEISRQINKPDVDSPELIEPVELRH